jgi:fructose-bisphosphate aldolase class II
MPLILNRTEVEEVYAWATSRGWVLPAFNSENLTTTEAILAASAEYGSQIGMEDLPVIIGITGNYPSRPQSKLYSNTRRWDIGMRLFLREVEVLTSPGSPYAGLKVMIHLDHIQWDHDQELLGWDMGQFSSIMYDASTLPLDQNIEKTATFMEKNSKSIFIEGACDVIGINTEKDGGLTSPENAERYLRETNVDILVANLGTEHRASDEDLLYRGDLARSITDKLDRACLCLHGTSSVPVSSIGALFNDGIRRVNIWTILERNTSETLFSEMVRNAASVAGSKVTRGLISEGLLGNRVQTDASASINYCTTTYRQHVVFEGMKKLVQGYLETFYRTDQ